ncbi:proline--tRNA ligase, mitochondrial-like [Oopsacas minuta]|uniref:proline--tRNA ligase n=1 Tax=Oopsacas minuta TaxID=111878 RepID=A0AAV7KLL6_9METZ|nr:proline--tRNA ligase, mitochondrial-like [Oopsacas minuta]
MQSFTSLALKTSSSVLRELERDGMSRGLQLLLASGIISPACSGIFHLMAPALSFISKLEKLIDIRMREIGATKIHLANLTPLSLWEASKRVDKIGHELFQLKDNKFRKYCLSPTHEEAITNLIQSKALIQSYKHLPLKLYQITTKYRDEMRPRYGLLRCREFLMKDLYTFDVCRMHAMETYSQVCIAYDKIFCDLNLPVLKTAADGESMGGKLSHEFQLPCSIGENTLVICKKCDIQANEDILSMSTGNIPSSCMSPTCCVREGKKAIELGHVFYIGTSFSETFDLKFLDDSNNRNFVEMGCYGLGVTRILGALCEHTADRFPDRLVWPDKLAPYNISIIPLSSSDCNNSKHLDRAQYIYYQLDNIYTGEVVVDNRMQLSHSYKLKDSRLFGFPYSIVLSDRQGDGAELIIRRSDGNEGYFNFDNVTDLINFIIKTITNNM